MDMEQKIAPHPTQWRARIYRVIFEFDTPGGKLFDIALLVAILVSVVAVSLETVTKIQEDYGRMLTALEWCFTAAFTVEYVLRLMCVRRPLRYAVSFFGVVDLASFLPTYISLMAPEAGVQILLVVRSMRLLRIFRILGLPRFQTEVDGLGRAVWAARARIVVFLVTILIAVTIAGAAMYLVEHDREDSHFTSIPQAMYWAVVTMTTVGYGDVVPHTAPGKILSAALILLGYSLIIVPTGFISAELAGGPWRVRSHRECPACGIRGHKDDAKFCRRCAAELLPPE